jgi:hypothetical protein
MVLLQVSRDRAYLYYAQPSSFHQKIVVESSLQNTVLNKRQDNG